MDYGLWVYTCLYMLYMLYIVMCYLFKLLMYLNFATTLLFLSDRLLLDREIIY